MVFSDDIVMLFFLKHLYRCCCEKDVILLLGVCACVNHGLEELCSWAPTMVSLLAPHMEHNADSQVRMDGCASIGRAHMEGHMLFVWHVPLCSLAQVLVS